MCDDNPSSADPLGQIVDEFVEAFRQGQSPSVEEFARRYPEQADEIREVLPALVLMEKAKAADDPAEPPPGRIGRYRVERLLGRGGFGLVYLAHDDQLQRRVAIKVPHARLVAQATDAEAHLTEARAVANLDHPNIVPVYDVGSADDCPFFIVSKYIDGTDLATRLRRSRLPLAEAVGLVATVAEALHHAHKQGLVHRDIKPGNILLDKAGKPFVADFGLALREQDAGKRPRHAGTPSYMSPEQARGEGHRIDGRSDVFSLGVVFYELLTGRRPFSADSPAGLLEQITGADVKPPRQLDDAVPRELERICLKALSKRASERHPAARDMADDLRHFLAAVSAADKPTLPPRAADETAPATPVPTPAPPPPGDSQPVTVVPKGLRSFDAADADFFLELLPGPRDRDGLPDGIRFWKQHVEATGADGTFSVGLIYGPSGCGKSSLVKAGLLPRLARSATAVYVEATGDETETRLLKALRRQFPNLSAGLGLTDALAALRRGQYLEPGQKVLLVLDQFEQWLHARRGENNAELVQALRQCDGRRLQGLVMVRDDFWLAVSRFMRAIEVEILEGRNSALVDLFDPLHARRVLAAFGRAYGRLPDNLGRCSKDETTFLDQAVSGLARDGKVIPVRLALFAEMVRGKPWSPATLRQVGGAEGVGVAFLEETFTAPTAPPRHRLHQKAAQAVLKALLPQAGTDIRGHMRSRQELLEASGYLHRPKDFEELLRVLDGETRLITPTDPEGKEDHGGPGGAGPLNSGARFYQLTHDYLVHSLRDWLTYKQKETRRGRAELLLADRSAMWNARPEGRQLPSLLQWLQIRRFTARTSWTPPQRKMMARAGRYHAVRGAVVAALLAVATLAGLAVREQVVEQRKAARAAALVQRLLAAETTRVPDVVAEMSEYRHWVDPLLRAENDRAAAGTRQKLHASLALLPVDPGQVDYLRGRLLDAQPSEVPVIRDALAPHKDALREGLWAVAEAPEAGKESQRLRAAAALARYDPDGEKWATAGAGVADDLVRESPVFLGQWTEAFRPVRRWLLSPLSRTFGDRDPDRAAERALATNLLADYAADNPPVLAELLLDADEKQFAVIFPKFKDQGDRGLPLLAAEIDRKLPADLPSWDAGRETLAKRQANAAVALLRMNQPDKVWPLLRHSPDPRVRSYLIHHLAPLGADAGAVLKRVDEEPDLTARRALLLCLGEFNEKELPPAVRTALLPKLRATYRTEADPGLHAAAEWLLRRWQQGAGLKQVNDAWAGDAAWRKERMEGIGNLLAKHKEKAPPQWYVNAQGQTFVVIPGPVEFRMGSPQAASGPNDSDAPHRRRIGRTFALAAKSVTLAQYRRFSRNHPGPAGYAEAEDLPAVRINWYMAAAYCNWLSKEEGIAKEQWCYEIDGQLTKLKDRYLSLSGYRLPTEAEMEYATRAGALTSRYYGESDELLPNYAWYAKNSQERSWPVGSLRPNDLGLFDTHGNVLCWCQESYKAYPASKGAEAVEDREDGLVVSSTVGRVLRGGSFLSRTSVQSSNRYNVVPTFADDLRGFRPARTLIP